MRPATPIIRFGQYPRSEKMYRKMLRHYPGRWEVMRKLSWLALGNDRFDEAIKLGKKMRKLFPTSKAVRLELAEVYRRAERYADAERTLKQEISINPSAGMPWRELARVYLIQGKQDLATEAFREGSRATPIIGKCHARMVSAY